MIRSVSAAIVSLVFVLISGAFARIAIVPLHPAADANTTKAQSKDLHVVSKGSFPVTDMQADFDGYVSAILIETDGKRSLLLPSRSIPDSYVEKGKPIAILEEKSVKAEIPEGLHYLLIVVSEQRLVLGAATKEKGSFSALTDDAALIHVLDDIRSGHYGRFRIKMLPLYR